MWNWLTRIFKKIDEIPPEIIPRGEIRGGDTVTSPEWYNNIPKKISFVDVETTGLHSKDRVVSIGIICLESDALLKGVIESSVIHLIFDPGIKSHPMAEKVHGYDDWILRHQEDFDKYAETIAFLINSGDMLVAHNASFDVSFINREFERCGVPKISIPVFCTMQAYRESELPGRSSLDAICHTIGIARSGKTHGAFEDAWLSMQVYLFLKECPHFRTPFSDVADQAPQNFIEPPPRPDGPLPRRKRKKKATDGQALLEEGGGSPPGGRAWGQVE